MVASIDDWIIRGVQGEHYPCKPDIFAATYEPADSQPALPADEILSVIDGVIELAKEARGHWDADRDTKVGKILIALSAEIPGYDKRSSALHSARRRIEGES